MELAIVLLILGILARTAIVPLTGAVESRQRQTAESQLEVIRQSVIAHVVANGALPCPLEIDGQPSDNRVLNASSFNNPVNPGDWMHLNTHPVCKVANGVVPSRVLGLTGPVNAQGALLDPWNRPYRMAISLASHPDHGTQGLPDWTSAGEAAAVGLKSLHADILVCSHVAGDDCPARDVRTHEIASLVWSSGKDDSERGAQRENLDGDQVFVWQEPSTLPEHPFDDQMTWIAAADVMYWMLRSGWLP